MYIPTVCMLMRSRHSVIHSGGIGVMALTAGDGTMAGDGIVLTTLGDILRVIGAAGMAATGVAGMAVAIGDIITIIINRIIIGMRQEDVLPMQAIIEEVVGEAVVRPIVPVRVIAITDPLLR